MAQNASFPAFSLPYTTATAGTAFYALIPGRGDKRVKVTEFEYQSGSTLHTLTFMVPKSTVKLAAAAAQSATSLVLASDPGQWGSAKSVASRAAAANDYIAYQLSDGTWAYNEITAVSLNSVSGLLTVTVTEIGAALPIGTVIYYFGLATDTNPRTNLANFIMKPTISATTVYGDDNGVLMTGWTYGEPVLVTSNNLTAQGYLNYLSGLYGE
jgi:hypothetical protein